MHVHIPGACTNCNVANCWETLKNCNLKSNSFPIGVGLVFMYITLRNSYLLIKWFIDFKITNYDISITIVGSSKFKFDCQLCLLWYMHRYLLLWDMRNVMKKNPGFKTDDREKAKISVNGENKQLWIVMYLSLSVKDD